jgi:hypothetical protein
VAKRPFCSAAYISDKRLRSVSLFCNTVAECIAHK